MRYIKCFVTYLYTLYSSLKRFTILTIQTEYTYNGQEDDTIAGQPDIRTDWTPLRSKHNTYRSYTVCFLIGASTYLPFYVQKVWDIDG